jgi:hypothetical protein
MIEQPPPSRSKRRCRANSSAGLAMSTLTISDGRRVAHIRSEIDAHRIVHTLGITQLRGPYFWDVPDSRGRWFVAEIRHRSGGSRQ